MNSQFMTHQLTTLNKTSTGILSAQTKQEHLSRYAELGLQGSKNTQLGYKSNIKLFTAWCLANRHSALPCEGYFFQTDTVGEFSFG